MSEAPAVRLRLKTRMIAVIVGESQEAAIDIPAGAEILVLDPMDASRSQTTKEVKIEWGGKTLRAFAIDLQKRAERIDPSNPD